MSIPLCTGFEPFASWPVAERSERPLGTARILVTGSSGFVGRYLVRELCAQGAQVTGLDRVAPRATPEGWQFVLGDVSESQGIAPMLATLQPTHVIHLAGVLEQAGLDHAAQLNGNVIATMRLLDAIIASRCAPRVLIASSSAVYGRARPEELPLREESPLRPVTPYGISKVAQEMVALQYHLSQQLWTVRVRSFNLIGPEQPAGFLPSDVARQIAAAERGQAPAVIRVGSLLPRRDYTDVRDAARAYALLAAHGTAGAVYNLCTGRSVAVKECVERLIELSSVPVQVQPEASKMRAGEISEQVGSRERLTQATGWQPQVAFEQSLRDLLETCRTSVQETAWSVPA